jgi:hypothetical protein
LFNHFADDQFLAALAKHVKMTEDTREFSHFFHRTLVNCRLARKL